MRKQNRIAAAMAAVLLFAMTPMPVCAESAAEQAAPAEEETVSTAEDALSAAEPAADAADAEMPVRLVWAQGTDESLYEVTAEQQDDGAGGIELYLLFKNKDEGFARLSAEGRTVSAGGDILDGVAAQAVTAGKDEETITALYFPDTEGAAEIECYLTADKVMNVPSVSDLVPDLFVTEEKAIVTVENKGEIDASGTEVFMMFCDEEERAFDTVVCQIGDAENEVKSGTKLGKEVGVPYEYETVRMYVRTVGNALTAEPVPEVAESIAEGPESIAELPVTAAEAPESVSELPVSAAEAPESAADVPLTAAATESIAELPAEIPESEAEAAEEPEIEMDVRELPLLMYSTSADYNLVVTNKSETTVVLSGNAIALDADGTPVAAVDAYEQIVGPGEEALLNFYLSDGDKAASVSHNLSWRAADGQVSARSVLSPTVETAGETVSVKVKNTGDSVVSYPDVTVLFFDADNNLIRSVYEQLGEDYEIQPGEEASAEVEAGGAFDHYEYYLAGSVEE